MTNKPNDGGPFHPISLDQNEEGSPCRLHPGISTRAWLAGMAMNGLPRRGRTVEVSVRGAVKSADAMLKQLEEP